jgi:hypothetical protein
MSDLTALYALKALARDGAERGLLSDVGILPVVTHVERNGRFGSTHW